MCTVSFIPVKGKFFITSNRDEKLARKNAVVPRMFVYNGQKLFFVREAGAGGSGYMIRSACEHSLNSLCAVAVSCSRYVIGDFKSSHCK